MSRGEHSNSKLQNSWNKYGQGSFLFSILEYAPAENIRDLEQRYIDIYQPELNISKVVGYPNTPKAGSIEAKIRSQNNLEARRNSSWCKSPELHEIMSNKLKERWEVLEYRQSRIEMTKALWQDPEYRTKLSDAHKKVKNTDRQTIRELRNSGYSVKSLKEMFGVSRMTIQRIVLES